MTIQWPAAQDPKPSLNDVFDSLCDDGVDDTPVGQPTVDELAEEITNVGAGRGRWEANSEDGKNWWRAKARHILKKYSILKRAP